MTRVSVRDARPSDAERIAAVARASWTDTYRGIFEPAFVEDFLTANYAVPDLAASAARAAARPDAHFLVAERDGEVVAFAQYGVGQRGPELFRIYADPAHFGSGVGHALITELERRLAGTVHSYILDVHSRNERGRAFYERHGFVIVGGGDTQGCGLTLRRRLRPPRLTLPIETERLRLRGLRGGDADRLHEIYGDAEAMRFIGASGRPTPDLAATRRVLDGLIRSQELHGFSLWAVDEHDGDELIGVAGLSWVENRGPDVEAAYLYRRDRWGRGYGTEALRAILAVAHGELDIERVIALAYPHNVASQRVMAKAGMRYDGSARAYGQELIRYVSETPPA